jgi:hypothetical protein
MVLLELRVRALYRLWVTLARMLREDVEAVTGCSNTHDPF